MVEDHISQSGAVPIDSNGQARTFDTENRIAGRLVEEVEASNFDGWGPESDIHTSHGQLFTRDALDRSFYAALNMALKMVTA